MCIRKVCKGGLWVPTTAVPICDFHYIIIVAKRIDHNDIITVYIYCVESWGRNINNAISEIDL